MAGSAFSGAIRRARGIKPGTPDELILYRGKLIAIELKSRSGRCTPAQRAEREKILRGGGQWWVCRSAGSAMWALYKSPRLPAWEVPRRDPSERRPLHPDVAAQRREAQQQSRQRQRKHKAQQQWDERLGAHRDAGIAELSTERTDLQSSSGGVTP